MKKFCMAIALFSAMCCAVTVSAEGRQAVVYDAFAPNEVFEIMKERGYEVSFDSDGDILWKLDGYKTFITFYKGNKSLQFFTTFNSDVPLEKHNEFNKKYRWSRSYCPNPGTACLELDLDFEGGITKERLIDFLGTCRRLFSTWCEKVL